jgi:cyanate permease
MRTVFNALLGVMAIVAPQVGLYFLYVQEGWQSPLFWFAVTADSLYILYAFSESNGKNR